MIGSMGVNAEADVTITINGKVVAKPCTVSTKQVTVNLGNLYTFNLISSGSSSEWKDITLSLTNCPLGTSSVKATFTGTSDSTGYYKNQGTAKNIQLQLREKDGGVLNAGSNRTLKVSEATNNVSFPLQVRALSVNGGVTQGTISGTINVTYTYM
ncbi:fimbrial protein [Erwiniaceae bacterium CAU 1747]